ncbi:MAG: transporter substrate-binding domain-containing protein [Bacteroidales bacterium]|nr:transporter substrate-binding domain-containing protein [Bacteroidales bacterium]
MKKLLYIKNYKIEIFVFIFLIFQACSNESESRLQQKKRNQKDIVKTDLPQIVKKDTLTAITQYNSTSYFIYKGKPMGYEYELLELFSKSIDVELHIILTDNLDTAISWLESGKGDIIAQALTITKERNNILSFSDYHTLTQQVLVQRKPKNWRKMTLDNIDKQLIKDPINLINKKVHVKKSSPYYERLNNLSDEIGGDIDITPVSENVVTEDLIKMVADGEIDYTVADKNIALLNKTYYPILDVETEVSFSQRIAWAVRKTSPKLLASINNWIKKMRKTTDYYVIYNKYFKNKKAAKRRMKSEYFSVSGGKISEFDEIIKKHSANLGWDWRLLASQIFQESRFDPKTKSWAGAKGLMQMMPKTAKQFGVTKLFNPDENIKAGTIYLKHISDRFEEIDYPEKIKFVLASYNVGYNHVDDARRLAEKHGYNPNVWDKNVSKFILLLSKPKYYNDEAVRFGYCRGEEPRNYVKDILKRHEQYKLFIKNN